MRSSRPCGRIPLQPARDQRERPARSSCLDGQSRLLLREKIRTMKGDVHCRVLPSILCLSNAHASLDEDTRKD